MFAINHIQNCSRLRWLMKPFVDFAVKITVSGRENIPISKPFVLVSNHRSDLDPLIISRVFQRYVAWVADSFLFNIPVVRQVLSAIGTIPASSEVKEHISAFRKSAEALNFSQAIGIFPEGHHSIVNGHAQELGSFNPGFAEMALHSQVPILPVTIISQQEIIHAVRIPGFLRDWFSLPDDIAGIKSRVMYRKVHVRIDPLISVPLLHPRLSGPPTHHRSRTLIDKLVRQTHAKISGNLSEPRLRWA